MQREKSVLSGKKGCYPSIKDFLDGVEALHPSTNIATLVGAGTLRAAAVGYDDRPATKDEIRAMQRLAAKAMEDGAYGISTGLIYTPGSYADTEELIQVVSAVQPYGGFYATHMRNEKDRVEVGNGWLYARVDGQAFLNSLNHHLEDVLSVEGHKAFSPYSSAQFMDVREAGTNPNVDDPLISFTSNWSERHVAYICGLGTFGLSKGLITKKGVSGRFGSIITDWELPTDTRPYTGLYDYCIMCGACARNCPGNAITKEEGKKHSPCQTYVSGMGKKYAPRFGCGKCQVNVPCERGIPNPKFR